VGLRAVTARDVARADHVALVPADIHLEAWEHQQVVDGLRRQALPVAADRLEVVGVVPTLWVGSAPDGDVVLVRVEGRLYLLALQSPCEHHPAAVLRDADYLRGRLIAYGEARRLSETVLHALEGGRMEGLENTPPGVESAGHGRPAR